MVLPHTQQELGHLLAAGTLISCGTSRENDVKSGG